MLDTHLLLWVAHRPDRRSDAARRRILDPADTPAFSTVAIWEVAIKASQHRDPFHDDPALLRHGLLRQGYREVVVGGEHAIAVGPLPLLHRDPFDRMMMVQARIEGAVLLTADAMMARYGAPVSLVA